MSNEKSQDAHTHLSSFRLQRLPQKPLRLLDTHPLRYIRPNNPTNLPARLLLDTAPDDIEQVPVAALLLREFRGFYFVGGGGGFYEVLCEVPTEPGEETGAGLLFRSAAAAAVAGVVG